MSDDHYTHDVLGFSLQALTKNTLVVPISYNCLPTVFTKNVSNGSYMAFQGL